MKHLFKLSFYLLLSAIALVTPAQLSAQLINTIAGDGMFGTGPEDVPATTSSLSGVMGIYGDKARNTYFIDQNNNRIRKIDAYGNIKTIAGTGSFGYTGDGGPATAATLGFPSDLFVDTGGNIFIADGNNSVIRKINTSGIISTVAGNGFFGFSGDGTLAITASLNFPTGICGDRAGNLYISDNGNQRIRMVNTSGFINTIAGTGTYGFAGDGLPALAADIGNPMGIAVDTFGKVYFADADNNRIRMIDGLGIINTVAGSSLIGGFSGDGGPATAAELDRPSDVHTDPSGGNLYIADNNNSLIRLVTTSTGIINTFAGTPGSLFSFSGDGGPANAAEISFSSSVYTSDDNVVYLTDDNNARVRRVAPCVVPVVPAGITAAVDVCIGGTTTATNTTTGGIWTISNGRATIDPSTGLITGVSLGTATISYAVPGECGMTAVTAPMTVKGLRGAGIISGPTSVCASATINLTDPISGGTWSSTNTNVATITAGGTVSGLLAGTTTISYTVTNSCGDNAVTSVITVKPLANAGTILGATSVCQLGTATVSNATIGGIWSSANTSVATVTGGGIVSGVVGGTTTISYTVSNTCGMNSATVVMTVDPLPATGTITGTTTLCELFSTSLFNPVFGGVWSSANTAVATINSSGTVTGVVPGTATISYTLTNFCGSRAATTIVSVQTAPFTAPITGPSAVCNLATIPLSNATPGGIWSSGNLSVAGITAGGVVSGLAVGTATITYAVINSCGTVNATKTITVDPSTVTTPITGATPVCEGLSMSLANATPGGAWSSGNTAIAIVNSIGGVTGSGSGTAMIYYTITNACGPVATSAPVVFLPAPAPAIAAVGATLSTTKKYLKYQWYHESTPIAGATNSTYIVKEIGHYSVMVDDVNGCSNMSADKNIKSLEFIDHTGIAGTTANAGNVNIFPNPSKGTFTVRFTSAYNEQANIVITNLLGQKVKELTTTTNSNTEVVLDQPSGTYLVTVTSGTEQHISKVTIQ